MDRTLAPDYTTHPDGRRLFENRDIPQGKLGTAIDQVDRNALQEELMAVIEHGQAIGARNLDDNSELAPLPFDPDTPKSYQQLLSVIVHLAAQAVPAGSVFGTFSDAAPQGYLECNGAEISRSTYSVLFAAIGAKFGPGDGSTTFNLPDLRGQFLRGWDHGAGVDPDAAARSDRGDGAGGNVIGSRQADEFKSHQHAPDAINTKLMGVNSASGIDAGAQGGASSAAEQPRGGSETRPKNVYTMWVIKI